MSNKDVTHLPRLSAENFEQCQRLYYHVDVPPLTVSSIVATCAEANHYETDRYTTYKFVDPDEMDAPSELKLPVYRGSSERLSRRWSWTNKIGIAAMFAQGFHEEGAVWVCEEVSEYLARFNFNDRHQDGEWHYWTEYILVPAKVRRMEHSAVAEMLTGEELEAWVEFMSTTS